MGKVTMKFGEKLKELRIEQQLSQSRLAQLTGISQTAISAYERGSARATEEVIVVFCRFFKVSADYMLGLSDSI